METSEVYLRAILGTVARQTFPPDELSKMVNPTGSGDKQVAAFNLCDGQHTQSEIAATVSLDKGSLSKTIAKWVEMGIVVRIGAGGDMRPLHVYPLTQGGEAKVRKKDKKNGGK